MCGHCVVCGAEWDSKCVLCRNVFWNELTRAQIECPHLVNTTDRKPEVCPYSGCTYAKLPRQYSCTPAA